MSSLDKTMASNFQIDQEKMITATLDELIVPTFLTKLTEYLYWIF